MCSARDSAALPALGCPIRESPDQWLLNAYPGLIAVVHALLRLLVPRHPPCALNILTVIKSGRRKAPAQKRTPLVSALGCISLSLDLRFSRAAERRGAGTPLSHGLSKLSNARLQLEAAGQVRSTC